MDFRLPERFHVLRGAGHFRPINLDLVDIDGWRSPFALESFTAGLSHDRSHVLAGDESDERGD
jgi:hypothetical protein